MRVLVRILGIGLLAALAWWLVDLDELLGGLRSLGPTAIGGLIALATLDRLLMAAKWKHLCDAVGLKVPAREFVASYYGASFLSYFLPTTLGGDVYRGYRISRVGNDKPGVIASLVMEKMIGVLATIAFAWAGLVYLLVEGVSPEFRSVFVALFAVTGIALAALGLSLWAPARAAMIRPFARFPKLSGSLTKLSDAYAEFARRAGTLFVNTLLALVEGAVQLAIPVAAVTAMGLDVPLVPFAAIAAINAFVRRSSMILDGWGLTESLRILTYGLVGVTAGEALAIGLVNHAVMMGASLPGALVFFGDPHRAELDKTRKPSGKLGKLVRRFFMPSFAVTFVYFFKYRAKISPKAEVEPSPNLVFGPGCTVSSFVKIKSSAGPLRIGERSGFATGCFVSTGAAGIEIGRNVLCGPNVSIVGSGYVHEELDVPFEDQGTASKGVKIGNNVWLGAGTVVCDGAEIGDNTIVVANSLVTRRYPPNVIIQGAPAKVILRRGREPRSKDECARKSSRSSRRPSVTSTRN